MIKNSHDQNHMSKIPMPKITCPKNFPWPKPHDQKFPVTHKKKKKKKNPWPKSRPKNSHVPKKVNVQQTQKKIKNKKINAPPNFTTTKIFDMSIHSYQIFLITMPSKKFPHDHVHVQPQKFLHIQNHNHKIFSWSNITYPTKIFL